MYSYTYHYTATPLSLLEIAKLDVECRCLVTVTLTPEENQTSGVVSLISLFEDEIKKAKAYLARHSLYSNHLKEPETAPKE